MTENTKILRDALISCRDRFRSGGDLIYAELADAALIGVTARDIHKVNGGQVCSSASRPGKWVAYLPNGDPVHPQEHPHGVAYFDTAEEAAEALRSKP